MPAPSCFHGRSLCAHIKLSKLFEQGTIASFISSFMKLHIYFGIPFMLIGSRGLPDQFQFFWIMLAARACGRVD